MLQLNLIILSDYRINMKKIIFFAVMLLSISTLAQKTYEHGWGIGLTAVSPRMFADTYNEDFDIGGALTVIRDLDEVNTLRLKIGYNKFTSVGAPLGRAKGPSTEAITIGGDYLMTFTPCSNFFQIYAGAGFAVLYYKVTDPMPGVTTDGRFGELVLNVNAGVKYPLSSKFMANLELGHHTVSTDKMDGFIGPNGGIFGGVLDSYTTLNVGITYYFIRGKETNYCALPAGAAQINIPEVDYDRIQKMIDAAKTKPGPAPEIDYKKIEDIINKKLGDKAPEKENRPDPEDKLYLVGINFDSGSAEIKSEYTTILSQNAGLLLKHSKVNVLITGYTDDQGTPESNLTLSNKRAENVKNYLIGKGVSASRITTDGKGAANPVGDNKTESGKAMNRRVEFTIK